MKINTFLSVLGAVSGLVALVVVLLNHNTSAGGITKPASSPSYVTVYPTRTPTPVVSPSVLGNQQPTQTPS